MSDNDELLGFYRNLKYLQWEMNEAIKLLSSVDPFTVGSKGELLSYELLPASVTIAIDGATNHFALVLARILDTNKDAKNSLPRLVKRLCGVRVRSTIDSLWNISGHDQFSKVIAAGCDEAVAIDAQSSISRYGCAGAKTIDAAIDHLNKSLNNILSSSPAASLREYRDRVLAHRDHKFDKTTAQTVKRYRQTLLHVADLFEDVLFLTSRSSRDECRHRNFRIHVDAWAYDASLDWGSVIGSLNNNSRAK